MSRICGCRSGTSGSTPVKPSSPASIRPVGPAPTMITSASIPGRPPRSLSSRPRATHTSSTTDASHDSHFRGFWGRRAIMRHDPGLAASPSVQCRLELERECVTAADGDRLTQILDVEPEPQPEIALFQSEGLHQLFHPPLESEESPAEPLD